MHTCTHTFTHTRMHVHTHTHTQYGVIWCGMTGSVCTLLAAAEIDEPAAADFMKIDPNRIVKLAAGSDSVT